MQIDSNKENEVKNNNENNLSQNSESSEMSSDGGNFLEDLNKMTKNIEKHNILKTNIDIFSQIAEAFRKKDLTAYDLFKSDYKTIIVEGNDIDIVDNNIFFSKLKNIGVNIGDQKIINFIKNNIGFNQFQKAESIELHEFVRILSKYNINDKEAKQREIKLRNQKINFNEIDQYSLIVLYLLSQFLNKSTKSLYDIFINKIEIIHEEGQNYEVLKSSDFLQIINESIIKTKEMKFDNLISFLVYKKGKFDLLSVRKIQKIIRELNNNEEIKECAFHYIEDMELQDPSKKEKNQIESIKQQDKISNINYSEKQS